MSERSLAMAYALKKRMAKGGMMKCSHGSMSCPMCHGGQMAEGGMAEEEEETGYQPMPMPEVEDEDGDMDGDLVGRAMKRRMSKGGQVANDDEPEADAEPAQYDDLVKDDDLEADYPGRENIGDERLEEDDRDVVSRIMRSRSKKDRMPRPA